MPEDRLYDVELADTKPVIEIAGEQHDMVARLLDSVEMNEQLGGLSSCEIVLDNLQDHEGVGIDFAFEYSETNYFALGAEIRLLTGDAASPTELFRGRVSAVSLEAKEGGRPKLRVMAEDALMSWRMVRRDRSFDEGPLRDLMDRLISGTGLTAVVTGLNDEVDAQQQLNETDLGFLRRLLSRYDADAQVVGEELHISPRAAVDRGAVTLSLGSQLRRIRVTADLAHQRAATELFGIDVAGGSVESITANEDQLGPGEGATGSELVEEAFPGSSDRLVRMSFENRSEAQTLADVKQRDRARRFVIAEGEADGNSAIRVGTALTLEGLGPRFSNDFYTVRACHRYSRNAGYRTAFTAESAYIGRL